MTDSSVNRRKTDRKVRKEAKLLLREARVVLRSRKVTLSPENQALIQKAIDSLSSALVENNPEKLRRGIPRLDELLDLYGQGAQRSVFWEYFESIAIAVIIALFLRAFAVEAFKIPSGSMIPTMQIGDHIFVNKLAYGFRIPFTNTRIFTSSPERGDVIVFINPCQDKDFIKRVVALAGDTVEVRCSKLYINGKAIPSSFQGPCSYWTKNEGIEKWQQVGGEEATTSGRCFSYQEKLGDNVFETILANKKGEGELGNDAFPVGRRPDNLFRFSVTCERELGRTVKAATEGNDGKCDQRLSYEVPEGHVFVMGDHRDNSSDSRKWGPVPIENIKGKAMFIWWASQPTGVQTDRMGKFVH